MGIRGHIWREGALRSSLYNCRQRFSFFIVLTDNSDDDVSFDDGAVHSSDIDDA